MKIMAGSVIFKRDGERVFFKSFGKDSRYRYLKLSFEGEIYNKKSLSDMITKKGIPLSSFDEEEILVKGFFLYGEDFFQNIEGVFIAFLYDEKEKKLYIFRDKVGIKTLFYYKDENIFLFSNSLKYFYRYKEFKKDIDYSSLNFYLTHGYVARPYSIFKNTYKLREGRYLIFDLNKRELKEVKYWDIADLYAREKLKISEEEAIERAGELLEEAVVKRIKNYETIGSFLSGGYDSTTIAAILQMKSHKKIHTFTAAFEDEEFNEAVFSKRSAAFLETNHHEIYCKGKNAALNIPKIFDYYEEPFFDSAVIPTLQIREEALSLEVESIFAGEGGDEVFLNAKDVDLYLKFLNVSLSKRVFLADILENLQLDKFPLINKIYNIQIKYEKLVSMLKVDKISKMFDVHTILTSKNFRKRVLKEEFEELKTYYESDYSDKLSLKEGAMSTYFKTFLLDDALIKVERAFFDTFIKTQYPYLDEKLIDFITLLDIGLKQKGGVRKYILKEILHKYIPRELMERPKKSFAVPLSKWGRKDLKELINDYLSKERIKGENIFDYKIIEELKNSYFKEGRDEAFQSIWLIMIFEIWYENFLRDSFLYEKEGAREEELVYYL